MKKKMYVTIVLLLVVLVAGINWASYHMESNVDAAAMNYSQFPKEFRLTSKGFAIDDELMRYPYRIRQRGDYVYVLDLHGSENFCHLFHKDNLANVASFAPRGNGPQEVLQALCMDVQSEDSIWVYDTHKREVTRWGYSTEQRKVSLQECVRIKDRMTHSSNCAWGGDSLFFFTDRSGVNRILKCNTRGEVIGRIGTIPTEKRVDDNKLGTLAQAWNGFVSYNPHKQLLAVASQLGDVIELYDLKHGTNKNLRGPLGEPVYQTTQDGWAVPTGIMGYSDIQITDRYIYAVFHGRTFKEIAEDIEGTPDGGEYIHVYAHDGTPMCRLVLDHAIYGIDVDEENGIIWATDVNTEEQILIYSLPIFLKQ